jgi:maltose O-acetyltransferase
MIMDSDFHQVWPPELRNVYDDTQDADVIIGDNVWLGARVIVLKGVHVGENSVIAAGSIVTRSIPANAVAAGNPARVVKTLERTAPQEAS